jgi:hypothetical protein
MSALCFTLPAMGSDTATVPRGYRIGYGRVSTRDQNPDSQRDALTEAGCDEIYIDKAGGKLASRPELARALGRLRPGDTLVINLGGAPGGRTLNQRIKSSLLPCPEVPDWANAPGSVSDVPDIPRLRGLLIPRGIPRYLATDSRRCHAV